MFVCSIKFDKKRAVAIVALAAIIICAIVLLVGKNHAQKVSSVKSSTENVKITNEKDAESYIKSLGWEIGDKPVDVQKILIPKEFNEVYDEYNKLQQKQGYDLTKYAGVDAVRYTYQLLNYPDESSSVVADIIVCKNSIIAADIQSVKQDGFMHELKKCGENTQ